LIQTIINGTVSNWPDEFNKSVYAPIFSVDSIFEDFRSDTVRAVNDISAVAISKYAELAHVFLLSNLRGDYI
jgi:hypothetical protein